MTWCPTEIFQLPRRQEVFFWRSFIIISKRQQQHDFLVNHRKASGRNQQGEKFLGRRFCLFCYVGIDSYEAKYQELVYAENLTSWCKIWQWGGEAESVLVSALISHMLIGVSIVVLTKVRWQTQPERDKWRECFGIGIGKPLANWRLNWSQVLGAMLYSAGALIAKAVWCMSCGIAVCSQRYCGDARL